MTRIQVSASGRPHEFLRAVLLSMAVMLLAACSSEQTRDPSTDRQSCHVIFDAGSSGTRLYIYRQSAAGWERHDGPRTGALSDPVRANRGKDMDDAERVTTSIVSSLERMPEQGPLNKRGDPKWLAFDWRSLCRVETASVYATAGMRLAERTNPEEAEAIFDMLNRKLADALNMKVTTRTLSGFEEGLFAWLAIREGQEDGQFGVAEMGGGSAQVTVPCDDCKDSRLVIVQGRQQLIFTDSYLGLGQDEMWKNHSNRAACKKGVGRNNPHWRVKDCTDGLVLTADFKADAKIIASQTHIRRWYLAGAFRYTQPSDIDNFCRTNMESDYMPRSSCFRAVYQSYFLNSLGVPVSSGLSKEDWTLGAVICSVNSCLSYAGPPECGWSADGCR